VELSGKRTRRGSLDQTQSLGFENLSLLLIDPLHGSDVDVLCGMLIGGILLGMGVDLVVIDKDGEERFERRK